MIITLAKVFQRVTLAITLVFNLPLPQCEEARHSQRVCDLTGQLSNISQCPTAFGGYSDVWKCDWTKDAAVIKVAAKAIRRQCPTNGDILRNTLKKHEREFNIWCKLQHDHVLPLYGVADEFLPGITVMVSPWLEHGTVTNFIALRTNLSELHRLQLIGDVAAGLHYLHSKSVVHGDLTGSNVLICAKERAHIADFGLSVILTEYNAASCSVTGATRWAAPELITCPADISVLLSPQNDMYSFGSIMYHILSGIIPYHKLSSIQVPGAIFRGDKPPRPENPRISDGHWDFIQRCWSPFDQRLCRPSADEACSFLPYRHEKSPRSALPGDTLPVRDLSLNSVISRRNPRIRISMFFCYFALPVAFILYIVHIVYIIFAL